MLRVHQRPSSGSSELDLDAIAQEELTKFQREYRVTEGKRKSVSDQAQNAIRKQQSAIEALREENSELKKVLALAGSKQNEVKDQLVVSRLEELLERQACYKKMIAQGEEELKHMDKELASAEQQIKKDRKEMGGVLMSEKQHITVQKQLRVMENRVEKANMRFNSSLADNAKLRMQIDHLRKERGVFEGLKKKLHKELLECRRKMGEYIENSTQAYDVRDEAQSKMLALKEKADKELSQYQMEIKELVRVIDHDRNLKAFMSRKDHERTEAHEHMEEMKKKREAEKTSERERTVMSYEEAFEQIKEATGITDIDQLVNKFIEVEDQNFALFNYVNELNGQIEAVQEETKEINEDIEQFKSQGVEMEEKRKAILKELEAELALTNELTNGYESQFASSTKVMDQLRSGIDSLFSKIGCDLTAITDMLGGHSGVTNTTILQYLGIIEQRANELLQLQAFIHAKESDDPEAMSKFLLGHAPQSSQGTAGIVLPSTGDDYDSESSEADDEGKPLTQDELRTRAIKGITRRENKRLQASAMEHGPPSAAISTGRRKSIRPPVTR